MALSAIGLCSRALLRLGATTIASFEEGTAESEVAANLYPPIRDAVLSSHPWSFATAQGTLPRLAADPVADWEAAYQLPADFLRVLSAGPDGAGRGLSYRLAEKRLFCNSDDVTLTYIFRPEEAAFPPFFDQMLIARLTAEFCIPITESTTRAQFLFRLAEDEFRRAKLIDAQQHTPVAIADFPLVEVRS